MAGKKKTKSEKLTILRYNNRKMYNPAHSLYVNAEQLTELLREDVPFEVVNFVSRRDDTAHVLCTILMRLCRMGVGVDHKALRGLIRETLTHEPAAAPAA